MRENKLFLLLALLMMAVSGAWADETLLLTIESKDYASFKSGSMSFDDKVTITFSDEVENDGDTDGWYRSGAGSLLTVAGINGYTITSCKFYTKTGAAANGYTIVGESPSVYLSQGFVYTDDSKSVNLGTAGVKKIEVYTAAASGYTVSLKEGTEDANKWTITPNPATAGQTVTIQYTGRLKVKGVKAEKKAAAAPSVPDGAISGVFSVSETKQVYFSKGNLRYASSKWSFFDNQYDYYTSYSADAWDHFGWSTSATDYGKNTSTTNSDYSGDFVDWGATMGDGWRTLTNDEWTYLFDTRTSGSIVFGTENGRYAQATINTDGTGVNGMILFPDGVTIASTEVTTAGTVNAASTYATKCTSAQWTALETKGCVFLPAAGQRDGSSVNDAGSNGRYWSGTAYSTSSAYRAYAFNPGNLYPADGSYRYRGYSVRLVKATTDAPAAKEPATVTTAPTGAAIVGVGKSTALVSGGEADGGTLMYQMTTTNTMPTSTDGFSASVPTAQTITASGTVYVWYYVKGDDTHSDSEIAATAIEVPVADIVWDPTSVSDLQVAGTYMPYEKEGITLSANADRVQAMFFDFEDPSMDGIAFDVMESGGYTFTAPTGKAFTKIEMKPLGSSGWYEAYENEKLGTGWALNFDYATVTWKGNAAASTVGLLTSADEFHGQYISYIAFYLSE